MAEFIPQGQTLENWDEMITAQIFFGGIDKPAEAFRDQMGELWTSNCPDSQTLPSAGKMVVQNVYKTIFWLQDCILHPQTKKPEFTLMKVIEGNDSFYLIQKAWKRIPSRDDVVHWTKYLAKAYVCDSRIPEQKCPTVK